MKTPKIAVALSLLAGTAVATPLAHAQTPQTPRQKYTLGASDLKVTFDSRTPYGGGSTLLLYKAVFTSDPSQQFLYGVVVNEPSARHAAADNGFMFKIAAKLPDAGDTVTSSHAGGVWTASMDAGAYCRNSKGRIVGRTVIQVAGWDATDDCGALVGPRDRIFNALVARAQGRALPAVAPVIRVLPTATPVPPTPVPAPPAPVQNTDGWTIQVGGDTGVFASCSYSVLLNGSSSTSTNDVTTPATLDIGAGDIASVACSKTDDSPGTLEVDLSYNGQLVQTSSTSAAYGMVSVSGSGPTDPMSY